MENKYKVVMKDGTVHRGSDVDHAPGFVKIQSWDGEKRFPMGDVEKIYSSKTERAINYAAIFFMIIIVLLLVMIFSTP